MSNENEKIITAYDRVMTARAKGRATASDYIDAIFTDFLEMHGDRRFADDKAVVAGIAMLGDRPVTVIGLERGHDTKDKIERNFASAHPEGYRKALRQMKLAEKFGRPVVCFIDTSGAYCGIGAEERGQGQAIAENLEVLSTLRTPVISILIGEGGSGGALALAVADEVWMLENSIYSVISPEGCASILWKDAKKVREAAQCLKFTAADLLEFGVIERIIPENTQQNGTIAAITNMIGGEKYDFTEVFSLIKAELSQKLAIECNYDIDDLLEKRYRKFRKIGEIVDAE